MSYQSSRRVVVKVENEMSEEVQINIEPGQRSIIGSLLFLFNINNVPLFLPVHMYADDTTVHCI